MHGHFGMHPGSPTYIYAASPHPSVVINQWQTAVNMAQRQRQRILALRNDPNLARFRVEGTATGKQLGTGSYGSVEEVSYIIKYDEP